MEAAFGHSDDPTVPAGCGSGVSCDVTLPSAALAVVDKEKVIGYLLNAAHPDNGGKAAFFERLGFTSSDWLTLADAFRRVAVRGAVAAVASSSHGTKYVVDGQIAGPQRAAVVRTIWIVDRGVDVPRLVTAYPHAGEVR